MEIKYCQEFSTGALLGCVWSMNVTQVSAVVATYLDVNVQKGSFGSTRRVPALTLGVAGLYLYH